MFVKIAENTQEREYAYMIRKKVFVDEQNVPIEEEIDQYEEDSTHFVLYNEQEQPVGAGRFRVIDGVGKVQRICVLSTERKNGAGAMIMSAIGEFAEQNKIPQLKLDAQLHAIPFYSKLGYQIVSDEFMDAGIPHKTMKKNI
ncbi:MULTISPECIES: GNAT family N-acetyltransferase [unclassified Peribacillus]|uniref:GNAT family N-acetyltransferase n=1 Tax=unclassified Peribacillus TaxID=2675266 RepID=UPI001911E8E6|nr:MULTISPECIES: GNAT family N-acetyltransferase [unclassified Peribacillus]MBK5445562.1 GNAT family N-acetyltransferase [Peribacillus sp. TH24]MBK5459717.1 GNAT family N-acetyltransferase [Peribacillus sp. TH27]MBK5497908.1 GNAT family N-acetyltransferase [Peribacillus sp. TH14]WMX56976.1 GNAT family N-acetyltransferase [Peribacillus sp. R9-11]